MFKKAVFPGKYIQGAGALNEMPALIDLFGSRAMILASPTVIKKILPACNMDQTARSVVSETFRGECCETELVRLADVIEKNRINVMIGMGGGKTIDSSKIAADRARIPVIVIPTIASTDAPCSGCAVVYSESGVFERVCYQKTNPAAVLVDTGIIAAAPTRFLVSGMGDALATWFEAESCYRTQSKNECGGLSVMAGLHLARLCYDTLLSYGAEAKIAGEQHVATPAFERIVEANILLSGIGFESSGLATAHAIQNGLTELEETHAYYHGEKVAFGVLAGLQLTGAEPELVSRVFKFCKQIGLPTTLAEIGLQHIDRARLLKAAEKACEPGSSIHHEAGEITAENALQAMIAADAMGQRMA
ncbi:MAG TPA: glycerol dehydrogenase [Smithella sp.]|nr:glycerol dehydrogenase [Smithella sp.]